MRVVRRFVTNPQPCAYLPDRNARMEYLYTPELSAEEYEDLMNRGYRKFGPLPFRPLCGTCRECRPIRIRVDTFRPNRSQRRAWARNQDLEVFAGPPEVDDERLELYERYHLAQTLRKDWPDAATDPENYTLSFAMNTVPAVELTFRLEGRLVCVVLTEVTPNVVSGIYHYHDPDLAARSLGTFGMVHTVELARRLDRTYAYFGYYVAGCPSLSYKARFRPCELLTPGGEWVPFRGGEE